MQAEQLIDSIINDAKSNGQVTQAITGYDSVRDIRELVMREHHVRAMLRALLAGKVLCEKEPVAWATEDCRDDKSATTYDSEVAARWRVKGWPVTPLYAPASPLGNASLAGNADTGKEGA
jgi:hypothetical protein